MRPAFLLALFPLLAAPALAEPLMLAKGNWSTTSDIYFTVTTNGEARDIPSEHSSLEECWMTDEEVRIDEGLASFFEGCVATDSRAKVHSFDMDLVCDFSGVPMTGGAEFAVSKGGGSFSGRIFLSGASEEISVEAEGLLLGHLTGTCPAPN